MKFKPMLAATVTDRAKLKFPYLASPKLDGIRCIVLDGQVLSRSFKPIRNTHISKMLQNLPNLDGELIVGPPNVGDVFNRTTRGVMSAAGQPDFTYHVFDTLDYLEDPFHERLAKISHVTSNYVQAVPHEVIQNLNDLAKYEAAMLEYGYEGVMLRGPNNAYKCGRATATENSLWKLKQFMDGEILITKVLEGVINTNEATRDVLGRTVRSKHQEGMNPNGQVGTIIGTDLQTGQLLEISPGRMPHDVRSYMWRHHDDIIGKIAKYKAFGYGRLNVARFATFQGFRDADDMS